MGPSPGLCKKMLSARHGLQTDMHFSACKCMQERERSLVPGIMLLSDHNMFKMRLADSLHTGTLGAQTRVSIYIHSVSNRHHNGA